MLYSIGEACEQPLCIVKYLYPLKLCSLIIVSLPLTNHNFNDGLGIKENTCLNLTILSLLSLICLSSIHFFLMMITDYLVNNFFFWDNLTNLSCKCEVEKEEKWIRRWQCKAFIFILHRLIIKPTPVLTLCGAGCSGYNKDSFLYVFMWHGLEGRNQITGLM